MEITVKLVVVVVSLGNNDNNGNYLVGKDLFNITPVKKLIDMSFLPSNKDISC